jgi:hypothetical protein
MKNLLYVICGGIAMVALTNCTATKFSAGTTTQHLDALSGDSTGTTSTGDATGNLNQDGMGVGTGTTSPGTTTGSVCEVQPGSNHGSDRSPHSSCGNAQNNCDADTDDEYVACILVEHGKSLKLGLVTTTTMGGVNSVAESVCVTKVECLGDVAKAFNVLGAYERGYCEHNPNVKRLTDAQVKNLLGI